MTIRPTHPTPGPLHVGIWRGPGIIALLDDGWHHFAPGQAPHDLCDRCVKIIGTDAPMLGICRVLPDPEDRLG